MAPMWHIHPQKPVEGKRQRPMEWYTTRWREMAINGDSLKE